MPGGSRIHGAWFYRTVHAVLLVLSLGAALAQAATYVYDANGRLRAVTGSTGASSEYVYDALGNLSAINSLSSDQLAVFTFEPNHGPIGLSIAIYGQGFSTASGGNTVKFNGTAATSVTPVSSTQVFANVPAGATSGPISITVGAATASSVDDFTVTSDAGLPPTVVSFSPALVNPGDTVAVTGTHLSVAAGPTEAGVGGDTVLASPSSDTQLTFSVPAAAVPAPVMVVTPYGSAQSNCELIVVPTNAAAVSDILASTTLMADETDQSISIGTTGKFALAKFTGTNGQWLSLLFSQFTTSPSGGSLSVSVYDPSLTEITSQAVIGGPNAMALHLPQLARSGTYLVLITPGNATAQFNLGLQIDPSVIVGGPTIAVPTTQDSQTLRMIFDATAGENIGLGITNLVGTGAAQGAILVVYGPTGAYWNETVCGYVSGCNVVLENAPTTGTYTAVAQPWPDGTGTLSFTATLSDDLVVALPVNTTTTMNLNRPGQNGRYTFSGTTGTTIGVEIGGVTTVPTGAGLNLTVLNPDGTTLASGGATSGYTFNLANLPQTGTYTVVVNPSSGATATLSALLVANGSQTVPDNGAGLNVTTTASGEYAYLNFTATAGENLGLGITNLVGKGNAQGAIVVVYDPTGAYWNETVCGYVTSCSMILDNAPATGLYSVVVQPWPDGTGTLSFTATLSDDLVVALPVNTTTTMNLNRPGQNGRYTFTGTTGTTIGVEIGGVTTVPTGAGVNLTVLNPDGTTLASGGATSGYTFNLVNLPQTGTYTVLVNPSSGATATLSALLVANGSQTVPDNGAGLNVTTTASGEYAYLNFTATAGENLGLGITNLVVTDSSTPYNSSYAYATVYQPNGSYWTAAVCSPSQCGLSLSNAPATGTYTVVLRAYPYDTGTLSFTATLSDDLVVALPVNTTTAMDLARAGENGRYTFSGTAGTTVGVEIGGLTTAPAGAGVNLTVLNPDGTTLASGSATAGYTFNLANLPQTGTYTVFVNPGAGATATLSAVLVANGSQTVSTNGAALNLSTTASGEYAYLNFTAMEGENLGLGITNLVVTDSSTPYSSSYAYIKVYLPNGSYWTAGVCSPSQCGLTLSNAPATGVYSVVVQPFPYGTGTLSFTTTFSDDLVVTLPVNSTTAMNLSRPGQNGRYTFSGTAGMAVGVEIGGVTTTPAGAGVSLAVLNPDGTTLSSGSAQAGYTFNLPNLPQTGTYTIFVNPGSGATATLSALLVANGSETLATNGDALNVATTASGEYAYFNFTATAGENLGLGITNLAVTDTSTPYSSSYAYVTVYQPNGSYWTATSCSPTQCGLSLGNAPATGTYTVLLQPYPYGTGMLNFMATISDDLVVALPVNTSTAMDLTRAGQNGRYTFIGNAGTMIALAIGGVTTVPAGAGVNLTVLNPDGTTLASGSATAGYTFNLANLPQTGTYTVLVNPGEGATATLSALLVANASQTLATNGDGVTVSTTASGEYAYLDFTATAGANLALSISNLLVTDNTTPNASSYAYLTVYQPDGTYETAIACNPSQCGLTLSNVSEAGTYRVIVQPWPYGTGTLSFTATLTSN